MDFTPETQTLERAIEFLRLFLKSPIERLSKEETKDVFSTLSMVVDDIYYVDDLMPLEEFAEKFENRKDKEAFLHVLELLDIAFALLDEILGPEPEDPMDEAGHEVPESDLDPDDPFAPLLRNYKPNRHAS